MLLLFHDGIGDGIGRNGGWAGDANKDVLERRFGDGEINYPRSRDQGAQNVLGVATSNQTQFLNLSQVAVHLKAWNAINTNRPIFGLNA
jgi:hypothetical protein